MGNYDIIMALWEDGKMKECLKLYKEMREENALTKEEIEKLDSLLPDEGELLMEDIESKINHNTILKLYSRVKSKRNWTDDDLSKNLKISKDEIKRIKALRTKSKNLFYKLLEEYQKDELK